MFLSGCKLSMSLLLGFLLQLLQGESQLARGKLPACVACCRPGSAPALRQRAAPLHQRSPPGCGENATSSPLAAELLRTRPGTSCPCSNPGRGEGNTSYSASASCVSSFLSFFFLCVFRYILVFLILSLHPPSLCMDALFPASLLFERSRFSAPDFSSSV